MSDPKVTTRREFLRSLTLAGVGATVPVFVNDLAWAIANPLDAPLVSSKPGVPDDRILVIVQLAGGNDGLNTVIPYRDDNYYANRPNIAIRPDQVLRLRGDVGLHPAATGLKELYDEGLLSIVQGVGYPNPNRSHFVSNDIWETASPEQSTVEGWVGRYFDHQCSGSDPAPAESAIAITGETPRAFMGDTFDGIAFTDLRKLEWEGDDSMRGAFEKLNGPAAAPASTGDDDKTSYLTRIAMDARASAERMRRAMERRTKSNYPNHAFGRSMLTISKMIQEQMPTRVYYASLGGFDTHSAQLPRHAQLMTQFGATMKAFLTDLAQQGNLDRTVVLTFSEFGRRVAQNASGGTDHGEAAPLFLFGGDVRPGIVGRHPNLDKLHRGDLKYRVDFRQVYSAILGKWLAADPEAVLGRRFKPLDIFKTV